MVWKVWGLTPAWKIIPVSKWLITMIVSPRFLGLFPFQMVFLWLKNEGYQLPRSPGIILEVGGTLALGMLHEIRGGPRIIPRFLSKIGWLGSNEMSYTLGPPQQKVTYKNTKHDVTAGLMNDLLRHHDATLKRRAI